MNDAKLCSVIGDLIKKYGKNVFWQYPELLEALICVLPGIDKRKAGQHLSADRDIPESLCVIFDQDVIYTNNDRISISYPIKTKITGAVPAIYLLKLIKRVEDDELSVLAENGKLVIKGKRMTATWKLKENITLPNPLRDCKPKWRELPPDFLQGLKFCLFSTVIEAFDPITEAFTHIRADGKYIDSCDNHRLTRYEMREPIKGPLLIPAEVVKNICKLNPNRFASNDIEWLHFQNERGATISCRTTKDKYPNLDRFLEVKGQSLDFPEGIIDAISRSEALSESLETKSDAGVEISIDKKKLTCRTDYKDKQIGWIEEDFDVDYSGPKIEFDVNPFFFSEIVTKTRRAIIGKKRILFLGPNFRHALTIGRSA